MICYQCKEKVKEYIHVNAERKCDTINCNNAVNYWYRACKECSEKFNECEVCRGNLEDIENNRWM